MRPLLMMATVVVAACASATYEGPPLAPVSDFSPLLPYSSAEASCMEFRTTPEQFSAQYGLAYGDPVQQRVVVMLGQDGEPANYSDIRGDMRPSDGVDGAQTMILISFSPRGAASLSNTPAGGERERMYAATDDALNAESLGSPADRIEEILATCS